MTGLWISLVFICWSCLMFFAGVFYAAHIVNQRKREGRDG